MSMNDVPRAKPTVEKAQVSVAPQLARRDSLDPHRIIAKHLPRLGEEIAVTPDSDLRLATHLPDISRLT